MIFAAGFGTRMGDLTKTTPKPMLQLRGKPMIDHTLDLAKNAGIETVFANTHHLHAVIAPHLRSLGVTVIHENPEILDTGGGLKAASGQLTSPTLTINPDYIWSGPNPLTHLLQEWRADMQSLLLVVPPDQALNRTGPGDFTISNSQLTRGGSMVYTGAQLIRTERLAEITERVFSLNAYWDLLAQTDNLHGTIYPGTWTDIGTKQSLIKANEGHDV
ncbi:MAG: nucleotidyltransferase family protein [Boseongicola sp.]|nr:nucleotidyltransferase family protein [Boseongicola sp.]